MFKSIALYALTYNANPISTSPILLRTDLLGMCNTAALFEGAARLTPIFLQKYKMDNVMIRPFFVVE